MPKHQIDLKHQFKSISEGIWDILYIPVVLVVFWIWKDINPFDPVLWGFIFLWTLFLYIPVFILHPTYYLINKKTEAKIDQENHLLQITDQGKTKKLEWNKLKEVERIYFSDYRHPEWQQNWIPVPWRNYGLLRIQTHDNKEFFLTSLMIDVVNPPIEPTKDTFKFIPLPPKSLKRKEREAKERKLSRRRRIQFFKNKFMDLSKTELEKKSDSHELVFEARKAAQELISETNKKSENN